jgi:cobalt-zinc-cadmium resistance protein CzcA
MEKELVHLPGQNFEFSQPIELRFNELISGVRSDVAVKVFGDDLEQMKRKADEIAKVAVDRGRRRRPEGGTDDGPPGAHGWTSIRAAIGRYGLAVEDVQDIVSAAVGGAQAGQVYDGDRRFALVVRMPEALRGDVPLAREPPIPLPEHVGDREEEGAARERFVPLGALARVSIEEGPNRSAARNGKRRVVVQCNVRGRDLGGFVADAQRRLDAEVQRDPGTWLAWGGQFENLIAARERLGLVVPIALFLILGLLYGTFGGLKNALLIFTGVPLALTGASPRSCCGSCRCRYRRPSASSRSSGVAVLNGLVMVTYFIDNLRQRGMSVDEAVLRGSVGRLRPVLMTALVAALGFVPMALATGTGSEVQRPLATVVIGGILSSTALTLVVLPVIYRMAHRDPRGNPMASEAAVGTQPPDPNDS